ncbi:MAG TPA: phosphoribosylformylglycinamidine synthase subunit PurL [Kofleriaceae bacterium]|nr:phosphoribosylformylglycinamidine synthase subunit PurL [Kofleriaceae bacterium]
MKVDEKLALAHGLTSGEYASLCEGLGRVPTYAELGMASVMWSEHCSYKSSRPHLATLPSDGERVVVGPGENAGAVDIGDGQVAVFKMESHNHPSFIEPVQGAATGVGGICRDVFTMGARPIAIADCLRFGPPESARTRYLVSGVVNGIGGYGNSFGVPTIAGDVAFDESYAGNILVNAFCLGVARRDRIFLGAASGAGNPILYVGARTGRDGIHGATMASAEFSEDAEAKRPNVQVGDPFMEKLLLEACLELMTTDVLVGIQDMGAAGLTSSAVEMAARAGSGVDMNLDRVPVREAGMTAYELLLSESQERMLMVVARGREEEALAVFEKWDLAAAVIGEVTTSGRVVVRMGGVIEADMPAALLADGPRVVRPSSRPAGIDAVHGEEAGAIGGAPEPTAALIELLSCPDIASKAWVFRQYDHEVRHGTVIRPGEADAGVVRVLSPDGTREKALAVTAGCPQRYVALDPYEGSRLAVCEAVANLAAVGAEPIGVTDCLNFGNPEKPEIMWQLVESVRGLGDACRALGVPVVSGNVSLYNESNGSSIAPTPMLAMVGLVADASRATTLGFGAAGQVIAIIGALSGNLAGSAYQQRFARRNFGRLTAFDYAQHGPALKVVRGLIEAGSLASAHDISDGGLAVAMAESAIAGSIGASIELPARGSAAELLFGEGPARFVISFAPVHEQTIRAQCERLGVDLYVCGHTGGSSLSIHVGDGEVICTDIATLADGWRGGFGRAIGQS